MKKKQLFLQNNELWEKLNAAENQIKVLESELEKSKSKIDALQLELERSNAKLNATEPLKALEAKLKKQAALSKDVEYGSAVIGKIVVEAAKYCNALTSSVSNGDVKELINLILGRTEVAKSEILKIINSSSDFSEKKELIDTQLLLAEDYFKSVAAQSNELEDSNV